MQANSFDTADQMYEGGTMFPAMNLGPVLEAVQEITGLFAMIDTTALDIQMHVAYTVLSEVALLLFNLLQIVTRAVASVVLSLFSGGSEVVKTLLKTGIDLLMILVIHVYIPLVMAMLDLIMCLIGFVQPGTWPAQLKCVERTCFTESGDIGAQWIQTHNHTLNSIQSEYLGAYKHMDPSHNGGHDYTHEYQFQYFLTQQLQAWCQASHSNWNDQQ